MNISLREHPAKKSLQGDEVIVIPAGKKLKIETSPDGVEILNYTFPEGKDWNVSISIRAAEKNT